ncbi:MAG TPA: YkvA family protein [Pirellulales bacterium]|nr:YkvA family protein [Pirellulales bacterium]
MASFFQMLSVLMMCCTLLGIAWVVALSLPKSRLRTLLSEILSWAFVVGCALFVVSPVDLAPEAFLGPFGFVDDAGAVFLGYQSFKSAMQLRRERHESEF